ncbi:MAG: FliI/YscN family ATPase [Phycisphaerales bacterium]
MNPFAEAAATLEHCEPMRVSGRVSTLRGMTLLVDDLPAQVGARVEIRSRGGARHAEVVGFEGRRTIVMMLGSASGVRPGDAAIVREETPTVRVGAGMLGRIVDGLGRPIDGKGPIVRTTPRLLHPQPLGAMRRRRINEALPTGVRAIDLMTTIGRGQRMGVFAGPGVGKSTLLGMLARGASADVSVIALIGERGREVREFIDDALGEEGLARSIVVVATSDEAPLMRMRAAAVACAAAEHFRDQGLDALLMIDSVTRFAHAQRQIGLAAGEPPTTKGYTPSVFSMLPAMLERAGAVEGPRGGSVTGMYTILVEGDDMTEPIADAARGILDGHIILARRLANRGHFPAVDVLDSISRVADHLCPKEHIDARRMLRRLLAAYDETEELIRIGAYARGSDPVTDVAIDFRDRIDAVLQQSTREATPLQDSVTALVGLMSEAAPRLAERTA